jgi:hypothetical protein
MTLLSGGGHASQRRISHPEPLALKAEKADENAANFVYMGMAFDGDSAIAASDFINFHSNFGPGN